ncbi:MAG: hypothetical protein AAGF20_05455, partial [Pseudomonadota bacterium]
MSFVVTLDLTGDASDTDGGDNEYVSCAQGEPGSVDGPGFALYNVAEIDTDLDGDIDDSDDACGDLPNIVLEKD